MSVTGLCQICTSEEAEESCRLCGKLVCERHYEDSLEQCVECAADSDGEPITDSDEMPDGVDTYQF
ncbi:hypothetical protein [Halovenus sp. HT40]|uniref:hypothetical protein n=1 Tax=Halovenus sp. HT40 TaxID=3126691 RepID=UPI00300F5BB1